MKTERDKALPRLHKIWDAGGTIHFDFVPGYTYEQVNLALDAMENSELTDPEPHDWDDSHA